MATEGFLAPDLCLFGDNAYVNDTFMATPFPNVSVDSVEDAYNFYHSQLRITIECAFGMLVNRWGILRKPLSQNYELHKIVALVIFLCRLHNFMIDEGVNEERIAKPTYNDELYMRLNGGVTLTEHTISGENVYIPHSLICRKEPELSDDFKTRMQRIRQTKKMKGLPRSVIKKFINEKHVEKVQKMKKKRLLPRNVMFNIIKEHDYRRPDRTMSKKKKK